VGAPLRRSSLEMVHWTISFASQNAPHPGFAPSSPPCANLCFAGPKRDHVFMTATQSIFMLRVNMQGAAPG